MRIVEVINSLAYRGGAQVLFFELCKEMAAITSEPLHIVLLYDRMDDSFQSIRTTDRLVFHTVSKKRSFDIVAARRLRKLIISLQPDIVNYHLPFLTTYFLAFGSRRRKWNLVKTYHSIPLQDTNRLESLLQRLFVKRGNLAFIGISKRITELSLRFYPKAKTRTILNGIRLQPSRHETDEFVYDFVIVASFSPVKNHALLFQAFKEYLRHHPCAKLLCVGGGQLMDEYVDSVKRNGLQNNIFFTGERKDVSGCLACSRVFVLSSVREGNPISILEAMSFGLPIIAPDIGGIPDIVENGVNGCLFECGDLAGLLRAMETLQDHDLWIAISKSNQQKSESFSITETARKYLDFFTDLKRIESKSEDYLSGN